MAKANNDSNTIDWIWLRDTLQLAVAALGSVALAKELLTEWLAAGKLPWDCMSWDGLDEEGLAKRRREQEQQREREREQERVRSGSGSGGGDRGRSRSGNNRLSTGLSQRSRITEAILGFGAPTS